MHKKILLAQPNYSSFKTPMTKALKSLGFTVAHFDYYAPNIFIKTFRIASNFGVNQIIKSSQLTNLANRQLVKKVAKFKPDYLLVIKGETLKPDIVHRINQMGVITINWFPDNLVLWDMLIKTANEYKFYFSVCTQLTKKLNSVGVKTHYLPVAGDADKQIINLPKKYDLSFVGQKTNRRIKYFSNLTDLKFNLWGYSHWRDTPLAKFYHNHLSVSQMKDVFRKSKIVVNVSSGEIEQPIVIANLRNFEATGVGAFVLSEYNKALAKLFIEDKEMVFYRNSQELRQKAIYYLDHETERNKIATQGWRRTSKDHTYTNRFTIMFSVINNRKNIK